jgi:hypothetical protein
MLDNSLDRSVLSCRIAPLEYHQQPVAVLDDVALKLHQLDLEGAK